jgi:PAS domain-containing protein
MKSLAGLIATHENWLMNRVLGYAKERNYVKYTSTLVEAWRISIAGLSERLLSALETYNGVPELGPDEDYTQDPIASFGILEAQRHRARGVTLDMFLGLMKYYRQSYVDLVLQAGFEPEHQDHFRLLVDRFFDRIELGFCVEWTALSENEKTEELQVSNRDMANEKNKYLTIFQSLYDSVILLDRENQVENINQAGTKYLRESAFLERSTMTRQYVGCR